MLHCDDNAIIEQRWLDANYITISATNCKHSIKYLQIHVFGTRFFALSLAQKTKNVRKLQMWPKIDPRWASQCRYQHHLVRVIQNPPRRAPLRPRVSTSKKRKPLKSLSVRQQSMFLTTSLRRKACRNLKANKCSDLPWKGAAARRPPALRWCGA